MLQLSTLSHVAPASLFVPARLDLAIKHRFFRHLHAHDDPDSLRVYRWHIETRTGGIEPRSWKRSVDDYVSACLTLKRSMMRNGWSGKPIERGSNGNLHDGAHRVACALACNIASVPIETWDQPCRSRPWDSAWMSAAGMPWADLARTYRDWKAIAESHHHHA